MTEQLKEIAQRIRALREIMDITPLNMAKACDVSLEEYYAYENGEKDFSFSFFYNVANVLGVDVVDIMSGDSPKLHTCCVVRKGEGYEIKRRNAYSYRHLAYTFRSKKAEPFLVTVTPKEETPQLHAHDGQEFNYMVSGRMKFFINDMVYELSEGDSVYFDSAFPHAMQSMDNKDAQFIAVVLK